MHLPVADVIPQEEAVPAASLGAAGELGEQARFHQLVERRQEDAALDGHESRLYRQV